MSAFRRLWVCAILGIAFSFSGCRTTSQMAATSAHSNSGTRSISVPSRKDVPRNELENVIQPVAHQASEVTTSGDLPAADDLFSNNDELQLEVLIAAVHARNPSMQVAQAAWSEAAERYPQVVALDDPTLQTMFAPVSFAPGSQDPSSFYVGAAQKIPWHGKRGLRGQMAQWEANAAGWSAEEVKLRLALAARMAFFDLYLVSRELELNLKNVELMQDFRATAKAKFEANQVSQQDLSTADLELAKLQELRLELEQRQRTSIARINTLLHRRPDASLPQSPVTLAVADTVPEANVLRELAVERRPELAALSSRIQSEQNAVALAYKEYYPDFEFMGRYDAFWSDRTQRPQVGMNMNVPLNTNRRAAAVREAQCRVTKLTAELTQQQDSVREEVQIAHSRVFAKQKAIGLYEDRILPAAETNLESARAAYVAGSVDFLRVIEAVKQSIEQQIAFQRTLTEYHQVRSELERAVGTRIEDFVSTTPTTTRE